MSEGHRERFRSVAERIKNRKRSEQVQTRECTRVMDKSIRPTIREASEELGTAEWIEFGPNESRPYIRVSDSELKFVCSGNSVKIITKIHGCDSAPPERFDVIEITCDLITDKIIEFMERIYDLD